MSKRFYLTTAIYYVNGEPHLGHAYEQIVADVIARTRRSLAAAPGAPAAGVFFLTGLDEHGQKVQQAAQDRGQDPQTYCDDLAATWLAFARKLNLSHDDFIRTTQPRHAAIVGAVLNQLHAQGDLYKAPYSGWYSWKEETFLTEKDRRPDGSFDPVWGEVTELVEDNWYFRMGRHQAWLLEFIEATPDFIQPAHRRNEVLGLLKSGKLEDLCISRPTARLSWGVPLPFDPDYVNYVWFDALVNYISVPAAHGDPGVLAPLQLSPAAPPASPLELWPADLHIIGKDILKFHAVYWPILLKAVGLPLPRQILVHGWWQKDGQKMSKTTGNIVDPLAVINAWGLDAFRYYVVRELDLGPDGNWTDAGFAARYHAELANGLGNLVNRSLSMLKRYRNGIVPAAANDLAEEVTRAIQRVQSDLAGNRLQSALQNIWTIVDRANLYVDQTAPFKLAKDPAQAGRLDAVLYNLAETCRILAALLWPFIPTAAERICAQLGLDPHPAPLRDLAWGRLPSHQPIGEVTPLFPRKDRP
jgi:methionyl-tRNA synthetase